jgi:ribonuclease HI
MIFTKEALMRRNLLTVFLVGAGLLLATTAVLAHHSQSAEFDRTKPVEFTGVVKAIEWTSPHGYTQVEAKGPDGKVVVYRVEFTAANQLFRAGWRRDSVKIGTVVKVKGTLSRSTASRNVSGELTLPDGKVAFRGPGPEAP